MSDKEQKGDRIFNATPSKNVVDTLKVLHALSPEDLKAVLTSSPLALKLKTLSPEDQMAIFEAMNPGNRKSHMAALIKVAFKDIASEAFADLFEENTTDQPKTPGRVLPFSPDKRRSK